MDDTIYIKSQRLELLFKTVLTKHIVLQQKKDTYITELYLMIYVSLCI